MDNKHYTDTPLERLGYKWLGEMCEKDKEEDIRKKTKEEKEKDVVR